MIVDKSLTFLKIRKDAAKIESYILKYIALNGASTQSDFSRKLRINWTTIHDRVKSLEDRGLLKEMYRQPSTHGRKSIFYGLTDEALAYLVVEPDMQEEVVKMLSIAYDSEKGFKPSVNNDELGRLAAEKWLENNNELHKTLEESFISTYKVAYNLLHKHGLESGYRRLLQIIERSAMNMMNEDIEAKLNDIKNDKVTGIFLDPYFIINDCTLNSIYQDAVLAKEKNHLLNENHGDILEKAGKLTKNQIVKHNKLILEQLLKEEISEQDIRNKLQEETTEREKELKEIFDHSHEIETYYDKVRNSPPWSRNRQIILD